MKWSALIDGELDPDDTQALVARVIDDPQAREQWLLHHMVGDALRFDAVAFDDRAFAARMSAALEHEPIHLPALAQREEAARTPARRSSSALRSWMRYGGPAVAVAAAIGAVTWVALPSLVTSGGGADDRATPSVIAVQSTMPASREYLLAHQQYAPSSRMQGMAPYVRVATFERAGAGSERTESR